MLVTTFDFLGIYGLENTTASQWNVDLNRKVTTNKPHDETSNDHGHCGDIHGNHPP